MWQRSQVMQASETTIQDVPLALVTLAILSALELIVHENILLEFGASKIKNSTKAHETGKPCEERRSEMVASSPHDPVKMCSLPGA